MKIQETKRWKHWKDKLEELEYRKILGLDCQDTGSNYLKKRLIAKRLKTKGGRTAKIWKMKGKQLYAVFIKTNN